MNHLIPLRRPGAEVGDTHEVRAEFSAGPFDLYGRHHEVTKAEADVGDPVRPDVALGQHDRRAARARDRQRRQQVPRDRELVAPAPLPHRLQEGRQDQRDRVLGVERAADVRLRVARQVDAVVD